MQNGAPVLPGNKEAPPTLKEIGITYTASHRAQKLASIPEPEFKERVAVAKASGEKLSTTVVLDQPFTDPAPVPGTSHSAGKLSFRPR